jgi:hypothetical protein
MVNAHKTKEAPGDLTLDGQGGIIQNFDPASGDDKLPAVRITTDPADSAGQHWRKDGTAVKCPTSTPACLGVQKATIPCCQYGKLHGFHMDGRTQKL